MVSTITSTTSIDVIKKVGLIRGGERLHIPFVTAVNKTSAIKTSHGRAKEKTK